MKDHVKMMKRQAMACKKILANETTEKALISKIYKQLMQLNIQKKKTKIQSNQKNGQI